MACTRLQGRSPGVTFWGLIAEWPTCVAWSQTLPLPPPPPPSKPARPTHQPTLRTLKANAPNKRIRLSQIQQADLSGPHQKCTRATNAPKPTRPTDHALPNRAKASGTGNRLTSQAPPKSPGQRIRPHKHTNPKLRTLHPMLKPLNPQAAQDPKSLNGFCAQAYAFLPARLAHPQKTNSGPS